MITAFDPRFGSHTPDHRRALRAALKTSIQQHRPDLDLSSLADLAQRPHIPGLAVSLSHCPAMGGFAWTTEANSIGLDVELKSRLQRPVVERICASDSERSILQTLATYDELAYFWVMKESAVKAVGNLMRDRRYLITEVEVTLIDRQARSFKARIESIETTGTWFDANHTTAADDAKQGDDIPVIVAAISTVLIAL